jgi:hypothetical protein
MFHVSTVTMSATGQRRSVKLHNCRVYIEFKQTWIYLSIIYGSSKIQMEYVKDFGSWMKEWRKLQEEREIKEHHWTSGLPYALRTAIISICLVLQTSYVIPVKTKVNLDFSLLTATPAPDFRTPTNTDDFRNHTMKIKSNISIIQRSQSKILRMLVYGPWHVSNATPHADLGISHLQDAIHQKCHKHNTTLETHEWLEAK